ncbi:MAG TPA: TlpA disulfide reductase family protein [Cyclobacteriaceae bacterium]|nr:TlpA disulfide reductase family protein [Cyclobacteriaceae bacterium]
MKKIAFCLLSSLLIACAQQVEKNIIELPVEFVQGLGPFDGGLAFLSGTPRDTLNPWYKTQIEPGHIPEDWQEVKVDQLWFDARQFAYQNYKQGKLTQEFFDSIVESWQINLDKDELSDKPLNCFVLIAFGRNKNGDLVYKLDSNHNFDFSDDDEKQINDLSNFSKLDSLSKSSSIVEYEFMHDGKIIKRDLPILIVQVFGRNLVWTMPEYAKTKFQDIEINVGDFSSIRYNYPKIKIKRTDDFEKETYSLNEFLQVNEDIYQFKQIDFKNKVLVIEKMPADTILFSTQLGFNAVPFEGDEFTSKEKISLNDYRGKYLFMEFWGSWCGPCIQEIPHLKDLYNEVDKSKVDFIGIAEDTEEPLRKAIDKYALEWKQILSDKENEIVKNYGINSFPSSFLIDPEGKIVAKNLRGKSLADTLRYFLREK